MKSTRNLVLPVFFLIVSFFIGCATGFAGEGRIALFPFEINSETNLSFLQKGVLDMLSARIRAEKLTIVQINKGNDLNKNDILGIAKEKNADFAISGSIIVFGNTININAFMHDIQSGESMIVFNRSDKNKDNLFNHINAFADEVFLKLKTPEAIVPEESITAPEKSVETTLKILATPLYKSKPFEGRVESFATGDVTGDGIPEIVIAKEGEITIAVYKDGKFEIKETIKGKQYLKYYFVDVIDTNNNGIAEIFITGSHRRNKHVQSVVYEWDGKKYAQTIENSKWFFSTRDLNNNGVRTLVGQKQHFAEGIFSVSAFELSFDQAEKNFAAGTKIKLPQFANIYDLAYGDIMNTGENMIVSFTSGGYLAFYDDKLTEVWKSSSRFGGSAKFIEPRKNDLKKRLYISPRIVAEDIDNDRSTEIVTVINNNSSPRALVNLKNYTKARITCVFWGRLNLETKWNTQNVSGYIPDFTISDIDNNGTNDLIYCVTEKVGKYWKTKQTYFVIQPVH